MTTNNAQQTTDQPNLLRRTALILAMIKFQHSVFALPFALLAAVVAAGGWPAGRTLFWIVAACVFARSAAMSFNRLLDERIDRLNPRTSGWALPAGLLSRRFVWGFCGVCVAGFVFSAAMLNWLAFALSPIALVVLVGYSTTKRWTSGSHFFLGLALGMAPVGAWIGVRGDMSLASLLMGAGVLFWVAGFDILYACQDETFDRREGLFSLPSRWGRTRALGASALCHIGAIVFFTLVWWATPLGILYLAAVAVASALLAWGQWIVKPNDISRVGVAFFTINGWVSVLIFLGGLIDILWG